MTTTVKIDAHAGWPVEVDQIWMDEEGAELSRTSIVVRALSEMTVYVHSTMRLEIKEGKREAGT